MTDPPLLVSLFCGMGGDSLGWIQAGGEVVLGVDSWPEALAVHAQNIPGGRTLNLDLCRMNEPLLDDAIEHLTAGRPFHLHGSPPCQNISSANPDREEGEGLRLVRWFIDYAENRSRAESWSMEQVPNIAPHLREWGVPFSILNAADFGVPQTRRRVFAGRGFRAVPTHADRWVSVAAALPGLADEACSHLIHTGNPTETVPRPLDEMPAWTVTHISPQQMKIALLSVRLESTGSNANRDADRPLSRPSPTLCGSGNQVGPRVFIHGEAEVVRMRSLTMPETLVLQGFPTDFDMSLGRLQGLRWCLIGNSVCPAVMAAVCRGLTPPAESLRGWV